MLLASTSCGAQTEEFRQVCKEPSLAILCEIKPEEAAGDAEQALRRGDRRLLAIKSYGLSIVGTNLDIVRIQEKYGYRVLADISDVFVDDEHRKLAERVVEYAKNYNISIIQGN